MQTVAIYFNDTIEKYRQLQQATNLLIAAIPRLSPGAIGSRCEHLNTLQRAIAADNHQLCLLMEEIGPVILDTAEVGEYQRAMDRSILACDSLRQEIYLYRDRAGGHA